MRRVDKYGEVHGVDDVLQGHDEKTVERDRHTPKKIKKIMKTKSDGCTKDHADIGIEDGRGRVDIYGRVDEGDDDLQGQDRRDVERDGKKHKNIKKGKKTKPDDPAQDCDSTGFADGGDRVDRYGGVDEGDDHVQGHGVRDIDCGSGKPNDMNRRKKSKLDCRTTLYSDEGFEDGARRVAKHGGAHQGDDDLHGHDGKDGKHGGRTPKNTKKRMKTKNDGGTKDYGDMSVEDDGGRVDRYGEVDKVVDKLRSYGGRTVESRGGKKSEMKRRRKSTPDEDTQDYGDMGLEDGDERVDRYGGVDDGDDDLQAQDERDVERDGGKRK